MTVTRPVLECQTCGAVVRELSPAEVQQVAVNPYNFIVFCPPCGEVERQLNEGTWTP